MAYDPRQIANFVLDYADERDALVTNLHIHKVIYFLHGWYLIEFNSKLVNVDFCAWQFGPVLPSIYEAFKKFKNKPVKGRAYMLDLASGQYIIAQYSLRDFEQDFLTKLLDIYLSMDTNDLVKFTHSPGSPWEQVWVHRRNDINIGLRITDDQIRAHLNLLSRRFTAQ